MVEKRPYQVEAVETIIQELRKEQSALVVGSTGLGKTEIIFWTIERILGLNPKLKFTIIVNKLNLLRQTIKRFKESIPGVSIKAYAASYGEKDLTAVVTVAMIQSISKIEHRTDVIIVDETHALDADSGNYITFIKNCISLNKLTKVLALTATPFRATGYIYGKDKFFKRICFERGLRWSIDRGYLVKPTIKHTEEQFDTSKLTVRMGEYIGKELDELVNNKEKLEAQLKDALPKLEGRKKVIWACTNIQHAENVHRELMERGELSVVYHSKMPKWSAKESLRWFEELKTRHLVFVTIVSEGYNFEPIDGIVLMRPTRSPRLAIQTIGRGLRIFPGKKNCLVLDYGRVIENVGPLDQPNVPHGKKDKKSEVKIEMKFCKKCYEYVHLATKYCPECDFEFPIEERNPEKNLTPKSSNINLLAEIKEVSFIASNVKIYCHISQKKQYCLRVKYAGDGAKAFEYFVIQNAPRWMRGNTHKRMKFLGSDADRIDIYKHQPHELLWSSDQNLKVVTEMKNGFTKIKRVERVGHTKTNPALA